MIYHTGIDVHENFCSIQHMDNDGALGLTMTVPTTKEGLNRFLAQLDEPTTITFEAGRNYWWLHQFFTDHPKVLQVNVVDPRRSRHIAEELSVISGYGRAKNDRIDGEMLAEQSRRGLAPTIYVPTPEQLAMRTVNRQRFSTVENRTRAKNMIHGLLAMHGASAAIDTLLHDVTTKTKIMAPLPEYVPMLVELLLAWVRLFNQQVDFLEAELNRLLPPSHPQIKLLLTVPGIGIVLARIIYTELLDINYFKDNPKYFISYNGLAPLANESAGRQGRMKLNSHSNHYLKYAFVEAAHNAFDHPHYRRKYELDVKKHGKIIAKLNLARRLAKTVYWMLTRQQPYRP